MSTNMYLNKLLALFGQFGQSMVDTLCLHNNTSKDTYMGPGPGPALGWGWWWSEQHNDHATFN